MKKAPDFDRMSEISDRLEAAQNDPDYESVFDKLAAEAEEACNGHFQFMEFLGPYSPTENGEGPRRNRNIPPV